VAAARGKPLAWTPAELDRLTAITPADLAGAEQSFVRAAPTAYKALLGADHILAAQRKRVAEKAKRRAAKD
jgi:hypothetical protein